MAKQETEEAAAVSKLTAEKADLQKQITNLDARVAQLQKEKENMKGLLHDYQEELGALRAQLAGELEKVQTLEAGMTEFSKIIDDLRTQLNYATLRAENKEQIVEHRGRKYRIKAKSFHYNGQPRSANDVTTGSDLLEQLVDIGAGFLEEIQDEDQD